MTATLASGAGPLRGAITSMVTGGVATFAGLADDTAATIALRFDGGGLPGATTDPIAIAAESATHLVVTTPPPSIVAAGAPFGIVVEAEDAFGNLVISFDGPVSLVTTGGTLGGTTTLAAVGGVAIFSGLTLGQATGPVSLEVAGGGLTVATTSPVSVAAPLRSRSPSPA